jgi:hypothetical protein
MSINIGANVIPQFKLGVNNLHKIMLGMIEIFPNLGTAVPPADAWKPAELFLNNELGGWWDLQDLGWTDTSLVLGAEVNPQPEFDAATGWFVGSNNAITGGQFVAQNGWSAGQSSYANALILGKTYFVEFEVVDFIGTGSFQVRMGNSPSVDGVITVTGNGVYRAVLSARDTGAGARLAIECTSAAGFSVKMNYLRVKEVISGYVPVLSQTSNGLNAVSYIEQPLGIELDKSKGLVLGAEVITNADDREFNAATGYWAMDAAASIAGGVVNVNASGDVYPIYRFNGIAKAGFYEISYDLNVVSGGCAGWLNQGQRHMTSGSYRDRFYAPLNATIGMRTLGPFVGTIDNISIREVEGNHLIMDSAAARPLWSKRTNQGTYSEDIGSAAYRRTGITVAASPAGTFLDGKQGNLITNDANTDHRFDCYPAMYSVASVCNFSFFIKNVDATTVRASFAPSGSGVEVNLSTMVLTHVGNNSSNGLVENKGNGEYRISFDSSIQVINAFNFMTVWLDYNTLSSASAHITGIQHTLGHGLEPYQAISAATGYDHDGFPAFAKYDGIDDNLSNTNQITLSNGSELYACFGVMVAGGSTFGMLVESGVSNADGGFYIGASSTVLEVRFNGAGDTFYFEEFSMVGFIDAKVAIDVVMDRTAVMSQTAIQVSFNGVVQTRTKVTNTLLGDGTLFKANPLYIGSRAGNALRLNGRIYNKTILGRKPTPEERTKQQNWSMAQMEYTP